MFVQKFVYADSKEDLHLTRFGNKWIPYTQGLLSRTTAYREVIMHRVLNSTHVRG